MGFMLTFKRAVSIICIVGAAENNEFRRKKKLGNEAVSTFLRFIDL